MHIRRIKAFSLVLLILAVTFASSCGNEDGAGYLFKYSLLGSPKNLDPQLATDTSSLVVIHNMYDGLLRIAGNGKLTEGVASDYTESADGLRYTFNLRDNAYWASSDSDFKEPVTAHDFVFAFHRIYDSATNSPYQKQFICLKNAEKIMSGEAEINSLGIKAKDSYTLEFELEYPNANFLTLLTTSAAMPCNEEFFYSTRGKYGLETSATVANGPFYLKQWEYDPYGKENYLILRRNRYFSEVDRVYPSGLNFFVEKEVEKIESDFFSKKTDCYVSVGDNKKISKSDYNTVAYENLSYGLVFNLNDEFFSEKSIREGLFTAIDRTEYDEKLMSSARPAYAVVPSGITMLNKSYRELVTEQNKTYYDLEAAKNSYKNGLSAFNKVTLENVKIIVPESYRNVDYLKYVTQQWQKKLSFYCGIEVLSDFEYQVRLKAGNYKIALCELTGEYNSPMSVLSSFETGGMLNYSGYSNPEFDELLNETNHAKNLSDCVKLYDRAETILMSDCVYLPIYYQTEYLVFRNETEGIVYNPFTKQIYFKDAKNFD